MRATRSSGRPPSVYHTYAIDLPSGEKRDRPTASRGPACVTGRRFSVAISYTTSPPCSLSLNERYRPSGDGAPPWQMLFLPVAHLSFISALVWIYAHARPEGSPTLQGLKLGVVGWAIGQVPLWLIWYAEQPWPGGLVVKQLGLEFLSSVVLGLTVAFVGGQSHRRVADSLATVSSVRAGS